MSRANVRRALCAIGIGLLLSSPACGKKAPLRLPDSRAAENAPPLRARVREGRVTLDFLVPSRRSFPEREDPWVLVRILRQTAPAPDIVEAGAILNAEGFAFDSPLSWSDTVLPERTQFIYHVEFRDAVRRRRALSKSLAVSWERSPGAPSNLSASGHLRSIVLKWTAPNEPGGGVTFRIYRREASREQFEPITPDPVSATRFVDARIDTGRDYCYVIRAVLNANTLEVEGPASPESCSRPASEEP